MNENESTSSDDIYEDLDTLFSPQTTSAGYESDCSCNSSHTSIPSEAWMDENDVEVLPPAPEEEDSPPCAEPARSDSKLKKAEMDLYMELLSDEIANRKSKLVTDLEFKELQEELIKLRTELSEKEAQVSDLTNQNVNLKKNICSLYKTAKAEIDQKDVWLAEANEKLNKYQTKILCPKFFKRSQSTQTDVIRSEKTAEAASTQERDTHSANSKETSRKRKYSPVSQRNSEPIKKKRGTKEFDSMGSENTISKNTSVEIIDETDISRKLTEPNTKFNLLPEEIKCFYIEHEQSLISSLNKLKQSLINSHFSQSKDPNCDKDSSFISILNPGSSDKSSGLKSLSNTSDKSSIFKDISLPPEEENESLKDVKSRNEKTKTSTISHGEEIDTVPTATCSYEKRTDKSDKHIHSDRTNSSSSSVNSKRDEKHMSDSNRHLSRTRNSSIRNSDKWTHGSYSYKQRRKSMYGYPKDYHSRHSYSPISKSSPPTLYKKRYLKRQLSTSSKKHEEKN